MKIGLLGTRGIPSSYSGFETCVEQLGMRLAERGHDVHVYCRSHHISYNGDVYKGMRLVKLPTIKNKYLDTIFHSLVSSLHVLPLKFDIALYFIAGNSPVTWIPRIVGTKTLLNVDGLDWKRKKWPGFAKRYIQFAEYLATKLPTLFLTDSHVVQEYYKNQFRCKPPYIPYGSELPHTTSGALLEKYGLIPGNYILFVGRLVPENCAHHLIEAFKRLETEMKCVIVGDAPYAEDYISTIKEMAQDDPRIVLTGYVFGKGYHELGTNATIFVETSEVGGTHPALVEAMAFNNCVIVNNTDENLETIADAGLAYMGEKGADDLYDLLNNLLKNPALIDEYAQKAKMRAQQSYSWDAVADAYEDLFNKLIEDQS